MRSNQNNIKNVRGGGSGWTTVPYLSNPSMQRGNTTSRRPKKGYGNFNSRKGGKH